MGKLTDFIGGQTVTDNGVTGERNFVRVNELPASPEEGIIYITPTTIANSSVLTNYELISSGSLGNGAGSFNVRISGDEGAEFSITGSNGASNVGNTVILPEDDGVKEVSVGVTAQADGAATRMPSALLVPNPNSDPETIFAEGFTATNPITVSQAAGKEIPTCDVSAPSSITGTGFSTSWSISYGGDATTVTISASVIADASGEGAVINIFNVNPGVDIGGVNSVSSGSISYLAGGAGRSIQATFGIGPTNFSGTVRLSASWPATATYAACSDSTDINWLR